MIITGIIAGIIITACNIAVIFYVRRLYRKEKAQLIQNLRTYMEETDGESPSEFWKMVDQISGLVAGKAAMSMKATFMGVQSAEAKNEKRVEGAFMQDAMGMSHPLLGMAAKFPAVTNLLKQNPNVASAVVKFLSGLIKSGQSGGDHEGELEEVSLNKF